jgi:hypothetical protein
MQSVIPRKRSENSDVSQLKCLTTKVLLTSIWPRKTREERKKTVGALPSVDQSIIWKLRQLPPENGFHALKRRSEIDRGNVTLRQNSKARTQEPELAIDVWLICYAIESKARKSFSLLPDCVGIKVNSIIRNSITARHSKALEQLFVAFHAFIDQVLARVASPNGTTPL